MFMKPLVTIFLFLSLVCNAQSRNKKVTYNEDKTGIALVGSGIVFSVIAVTVADGSEWTWKQTGPYTQQRVYKPFWQNPSRAVMLGAGVTITIGGLIYHKHNK